MPSNEDQTLFQELIDKYRYDFCKLVFIIFPFGEKGTDLENMWPYDWQMEEWAKLSKHLSNPETRFETYRLIISSGNGAAKTAFGAMTNLMLMYTQRVRGRITANTDPQMTTVVWPEYDIWFRRARYVDQFFEKFGKSIKARNMKYADTWRIDSVTWDEQRPASISGLHNKGGCLIYTFEEAPGIPAVIWQYAAGAYTETDTIKIHLAFGNSDDPESKFEQNMKSQLWHSRRIDTRELKHIDPKFVADLLIECNGNEDHDDFRVRVRGLPRKSSKDSIIPVENVNAAISRAKGFDPQSVSVLPCILKCDPAWTGGDETTIWYQQGNYTCLLDRYKLDKAAGDTHMVTYTKLVEYERELRADAVFIDQGEGTAVYTLATNAGKTNWHLVSFAGSPTDQPDHKDSEYANLRAQMYYEANKWLQKGGVLDVNHKLDQQTRDEWFEIIRKQLSWTKSARHKITGKKLAESKQELKNRVGQSPDVADGFVLGFAIIVHDKLDENRSPNEVGDFTIGSAAWKMPDHASPYDNMESDFDDLYD